MRLEDHNVIVTGAASGIGRAIAVRFAAEGAHVVLSDVREDPREGGDDTLEIIRAAGGSAEFVRSDISKKADVERLVAHLSQTRGRLDVIVNNAAIGDGGRLTETTDELWDDTVATNLTGVFLCCRAAVAQMLTQTPRDEVRGRIVNISSQHGMISSPGHFAYGVTKSGVVYMTRQIAADYAKDGIVCNAVAPGKVITGKDGDAQTAETLAYSHSRTPWPRLGRPDDIAAAALFLASPEATYITGENLMVDGGWMAG